MSITRYLLLTLLAAATATLGGCAAAEGLAVAEVASVAVLGRGLVDIGVSAVTGRDCSIVRLDRRQPYCAPREQLPGPPPFCTRTLARVQCWEDPEHFASPAHSIVDAPALTPEQVKQVAARWPKSLNFFD